jgi:pyruvate kinase
VAVTPSPIVQRQLAMFWGVYPVLSQRAATTDDVINDAAVAAIKHGYANEGDVLVVTGGTVESGGGSTDLMKVHLIERVLARGDGLGDRRVAGRVRRLEAPLDASTQVESDDIIVAEETDRSFVPVLRRAAGLIAGCTDAEAHCRLLALELGIPAVVGVGADLDALHDGAWVVLDARRGLVYERPPMLLRDPRPS